MISNIILILLLSSSVAAFSFVAANPADSVFLAIPGWNFSVSVLVDNPEKANLTYNWGYAGKNGFCGIELSKYHDWCSPCEFTAINGLHQFTLRVSNGSEARDMIWMVNASTPGVKT